MEILLIKKNVKKVEFKMNGSTKKEGSQVEWKRKIASETFKIELRKDASKRSKKKL